jgi:hypothetical protein
MIKQLKLPTDIPVARDIAETANTSAASIPLATHRLLEEHPELSGGLALQIGFGAGLVYGAQVVRLPSDCPRSFDTYPCTTFQGDTKWHCPRTRFSPVWLN